MKLLGIVCVGVLLGCQNSPEGKPVVQSVIFQGNPCQQISKEQWRCQDRVTGQMFEATVQKEAAEKVRTLEFYSSWRSIGEGKCCFNTECSEKWETRSDGRCYAADAPSRRQKSECLKRYEYEQPYLADIRVTETVTGRELTASEVMKLLDQMPNVKSVSRPLISRFFSADDLAYPQHASHYQISPKDWAALQAYCKQQLIDAPYAHEDVIAHWRSIVEGKPPFGLTVQKGEHSGK